MSRLITVNNLTKTFKVYKKESGLGASLRSLFKREYKEVFAVNDISFKIDKGEFVGFIGPNGAGKTTTLKTLSGLLYPTSGEIKVMGFSPWERKKEYLRKISLVMGQKNQLWWDLPASDSFLLNKEIYQVTDRKYKERYHELADLLEINSILDVQVRKLSLGERMRCEIMSSLMHDPEVLFLDEPTIGLDIVMQKKLHSFFKEYNKKYNTTVMLTSHYMDDVRELCSRVIIINHGRIMYDGSLTDLIHKYAPKKNISFMPNKRLFKKDLTKLGNIVYLDKNQVTVSVDRKDIPMVSAKILKDFAVNDIEIKERPLEDIIREVFKVQ